MSDMTLDKMSKDEKSLLLFFETNAVDYRGTVHSQHMNKDDFEIAKRWNESKFIRFGRIKFADIEERYKGKKSHWCVLSDEAWVLAHQERRARVKRMGQYGDE